MERPTLGAMIRTLRTERHMTQLDLARAMGVTDKAVSKWERNRSIPDAASLPKLAELLGVTVDELLQTSITEEAPAPHDPARARAAALAELVLKAVALAMGVGVTALTIMDEIEPRNALMLLGIGLACLALTQIAHEGELSDERA